MTGSSTAQRPGSLVCVEALQHCRADGIDVVRHGGAEFFPSRRGAGKEPDCREERVRLLLGVRQRLQKAEQCGIVGAAVCQRLAYRGERAGASPSANRRYATDKRSRSIIGHPPVTSVNGWAYLRGS
jgi:hypothetical protein